MCGVGSFATRRTAKRLRSHARNHLWRLRRAGFVEGKHGVMVALQAGDVVTVPISEAVANVKTVPPNGQMVTTARDTGISFGAPDEAKYHRLV